MKTHRFSLFCLSLFILTLSTQACTVLRYPNHWERDFPKPIAQTSPAKPTKAPSTTPPPRPTKYMPPPHLERMLEFARSLLGSATVPVVKGRKFNSDCSGFVRAVYYNIGVDITAISPSKQRTGMSGTEIIFLWIKENGTLLKKGPNPGDLVFFDNTYDRNRNGKLDDTFTHIGIVDKIMPSGTIEILHLGSAGVGRIHMNLKRPSAYRDPKSGELLNHKLRRQRSTDPGKTLYLSGQLFRALGSPTLNRANRVPH